MSVTNWVCDCHRCTPYAGLTVATYCLRCKKRLDKVPSGVTSVIEPSIEPVAAPKKRPVQRDLFETEGTE